MNEFDRSSRTIFLDALGIEDSEARAAFIAEACGDDTVLLGDVLELLHAHAHAGQFLPDAPASPHPPSFEAPGVSTDCGLTEKAGDRIGRYKLLQKIGEGGCGVVYMAEQEEPVRRKVALKVIKLGMDTKHVMARFEAERQALAMMEHPNIAKVLDAGATETGGPFFVMELVRGLKITEYCDRNELSTRQRLELFILVCQAVQHAHQKGIIHRDIKPSNILVTTNDGVSVPKVIDFGIAKATAGRLTDQTLFTAFEQFLGTPAYMSPEQAAMTSLDIDTRSDIYSLGVLLYELLTGSTPFDTKAVLAAGLDHLRRTIREIEPPRPSTRLTQELGDPTSRRQLQERIHLIRGDLDWIVMKCLEKDRARRFQTANALATDLQRHLTDEPISARPPSRLYELQKLVRRRRGAVITAGAVLLSILIGIAALGYGLWRARAEREVARSIGYASDLSLCWRSWIWSDYASCRRLLQANIPAPGQRDLRSFEWWYLRRLSKADDLFSLGPISGSVSGIGFLSENRLIASATQIRASSSQDVDPGGGGLFVWNWKSRRLLEKISNRGAADLSVSADGSRIAVAYWGNDIQILDSVNFSTVRNYSFTNQVLAVEFSPDGKLLGVRGSRCVYLFDLKSTAPPEALPARYYFEEKPAFSADSRCVSFMLPNGNIGVWDIRRHSLARELPNCSEALKLGPTGLENFDVYTFRHDFSPDGKMLASGDTYGRVMIHDIQTGVMRGIWEHFWADPIVRFSPDGKTLASAALDGILKLWDPVTGLELATYQGHESAIESLAFSPGGQYVMTGGSDGFIRVWDAHPTNPPVDSFALQRQKNTMLTNNSQLGFFASPQFGWSFNNRQVYADARPATASRNDTVQTFSAGLEHTLSIGGKFLLWRCGNGLFYVTDLESGAELTHYKPADGEKLGTVSSDGKWIASTFEDGRLLIREPGLIATRFVNNAHSNGITALVFSPAGNTLATASRDGWVKVWKLEDLRLVRQAELPARNAFEGPNAITFSWDGTLVACAQAAASRIFLLECASSRSPRLLTTPFEGWNTRALAFSPDGRTLAVCAYSDRAALFDVKTGRLTGTIGDGSFPVFTAGEFSPDGRRLALATYAQVTLWDVESKRNLITLRPNKDHGIGDLRFSPAGDRLVVTLDDGTCRVYTAPRDK